MAFNFNRQGQAPTVEKPQEQPSSVGIQKTEVTIMADADCLLFCDEEYMDVELTAKQLTKVSLPEGDHLLTFHDKEDPSIFSPLEVSIPKKKFYMVNGLKKEFENRRREVQQAEQTESLEIFKEAISNFLNEEDSILESSELEQLEEIRQGLNIDEETARKMIVETKNVLKNKPATVSEKTAEKLLDADAMAEAVSQNDVERIKSLYRQWKSAISALKTSNPQYDAIMSLYYMVAAAIDSQKLIQEKENAFTDDYWRTYWTYIAYMKNKRKEKAEDLLQELRQFSQYDEDNVSLLEVISALNSSNADSALSLFKSKEAGDYYASELAALVQALSIEMGIEKRTPSNSQACAFIFENILYFDSPEVVAERKAHAQAEYEATARKKVIHTLTITAIQDQLKGMMTARLVLGWGSSDSRQKFAHLPVVAMETEDGGKVLSTYAKLVDEGMTVMVKSVNGLGEVVHDALGLEKTAAENARREAEAKAKREAEAKAKREAEEKARREAEAKAKREAEEKARREAEAKRNVFEVSNSNLHFGAEGGTKEVRVDCNRSWKISAGLESWGTATPGSGKLTIKINANTNIVERTDYMTIKCGNAELRIDIKQDAAEYKCSGTTRSYTDNAEALKHLRKVLKENWNQKCYRGCITEGGKGVLFKDTHKYDYEGLSLYPGVIIDLEDMERNNSCWGAAITDSGYYCLIYYCLIYKGDPLNDKWYGKVPSAMKRDLDDCVAKSQSIKSVSIAENGDYAILTNKMVYTYSSNRRVINALTKASTLYGTPLYADITNLGVVACCRGGVYYENIPTNVAEAIQKMVKAKKVIQFISFTDSGTYIMSDTDDTADWYM